jgi:hypothetical protein
MGPADGVPQSDMPGVKTAVVDHTGQVPTSTTTFTGVDASAISTYVTVGTPTGRWIPGVNDCNTWAQTVIQNSTPHDIMINGYGRDITLPGPPIKWIRNVVVFQDGSIHALGK